MNNPFARLQNDTVFILNHDGVRTGPYKTAIGSKNGFSASNSRYGFNMLK